MQVILPWCGGCSCSQQLFENIGNELKSHANKQKPRRFRANGSEPLGRLEIATAIVVQCNGVDSLPSNEPDYEWYTDRNVGSVCL